MPDYADAISAIESGGRYDLLGPVTKTGDRAYGRFQVMGANIPAWTQAALGQPLTPQQFLASPEAQRAVFEHRFGQYVNKYGPEGAAKAWFAGEKGMHNPNARDQLGTSVASYGQRFMAGLGQPSSGLLARPQSGAGLLENAPPAAAEAPMGLLAGMGNQGMGLAQDGLGMMAPQMAPPPMLPPMPRRPVDMTALRALAGLA